MSGYKGKFLEIIEKPFNGINYEIVKSNPAVAAMLVNKDCTKTLLVKQFRPAADVYTLEIPAGMIDVIGENDVETICREIAEEVNLEINENDLKYLTSFFPMIGSATHKVSLYYAKVDEVKDKIIENDDVTERIWVDLDDFEIMIAEGKIIDGKTMLAYYMLRNILNQN